jgi:GT2 family glycosyltransferase
VRVLNGKSNWYWFKSIHSGFKLIENEVLEKDIVILSNVDVVVPKNYIENVMQTQKKYPGCIIGSQLKSEDSFQDMDLGPKVTQKFIIKSINASEIKYFEDGTTYEVEFASGRGMIFQGAHVRELLNIKFYIAQHYFSDYFLSLQMANQGYKIIMSKNIHLLSKELFGNLNTNYNPLNLLFSKKNPQHIPSSFTFFYHYSKTHKNISLINFTLSYAIHLVKAYKKLQSIYSDSS